MELVRALPLVAVGVLSGYLVFGAWRAARAHDRGAPIDYAAAIAVALAGVGLLGSSAGAEHVRAIVDRASAIAQAVACARRGDVLVIAGKGHEQGQELAGGHKLPFDDVAVAREALSARLHGLAGAGTR